MSTINVSINITVNVNINLEPVARALEGLRQPVQEAMADGMFGIVEANFGSTGLMRPWDWQPLSQAYAKKVGRSFATLHVTGALKSTLQKDASDPDSAKVSMGNNGLVRYALAHHHGNPGNFGWTQPGSGELPARRVFPIDEADNVTPEAVRIVVRKAKDAVKEALKQ